MLRYPSLAVHLHYYLEPEDVEEESEEAHSARNVVT